MKFEDEYEFELENIEYEAKRDYRGFYLLLAIVCGIDYLCEGKISSGWICAFLLFVIIVKLNQIFYALRTWLDTKIIADEDKEN